jgi:TDG/mug DNA glycosylase family protein
MARKFVLPDILPPGLELVFCGTAPGTVSAQAQAYYAHPQNKFWRILFGAGLTPRLFRPDEFASLPQFGIGLTDIAKHVFGMVKQLPPQALGRAAAEDLRNRITAAAPRRLAFTSLTGGRRVMGPKANFGRQKDGIGGTEVWILHSPSPTANWNWDPVHWHALAKAAGRKPRKS